MAAFCASVLLAGSGWWAVGQQTAGADFDVSYREPAAAAPSRVLSDGAAEIAFGTGRIPEAPLPPDYDAEPEPSTDEDASEVEEESAAAAAEVSPSEAADGGASEAPTPTVSEVPPTTAPVLITLPGNVPVNVAGPTAAAEAEHVHSERGQASWFNAPDGTCAHKTLPFGTQVTVTRILTDESITCTVNDRGPVAPERVIDLSMDMFEQLADPEAGLIEVIIDW